LKSNLKKGAHRPSFFMEKIPSNIGNHSEKLNSRNRIIHDQPHKLCKSRSRNPVQEFTSKTNCDPLYRISSFTASYLTAFSLILKLVGEMRIKWRFKFFIFHIEKIIIRAIITLVLKKKREFCKRSDFSDKIWKNYQ